MKQTAPSSASRTGSAPSCGCAAQDAPRARKAVGVDQAIKTGNLTRLRRIEGQVRGLQGMVEEDRYCADILTQVSSVQEALRSVSRELLRNHLKHCVSSAVRAGDDAAEAMFEELVNLVHRYNR